MRLDRERKQTLRLIVRGHDAKSTARSLGLSVHTINERLRDARRKLSVSSSREAARLLLEAEDECRSAAPEKLRDGPIGGAARVVGADARAVPVGGMRRIDRRSWIIGGFVMTVIIGLLALAALPQAVLPPPTTPVPSSAMSDPAAVEAAQRWLLLVDQGRWTDSYRATGASFRRLNTARAWVAVSQKVRAPLGAVLSRDFTSEEDAPTPPHGYELVKFRTAFANRPSAVETVAFDREKGHRRVVGVTIG